TGAGAGPRSAPHRPAPGSALRFPAAHNGRRNAGPGLPLRQVGAGRGKSLPEVPVGGSFEEGLVVFSLKRVTVAAAVAGPRGATMVASVLVGAPAFADPAPASYAAVGSDTIQDLDAQLARTLTSSASSGFKKYESWDAVKTDGTSCDTIATKGNSGNTLPRPNG